MKVTFDLDPDLYRTLKVEAARADRSMRDVVGDAIAAWLQHREEDEDRASAAAALEEYQRDGGTGPPLPTHPPPRRGSHPRCRRPRGE